MSFQRQNFAIPIAMALLTQAALMKKRKEPTSNAVDPDEPKEEKEPVFESRQVRRAHERKIRKESRK